MEVWKDIKGYEGLYQVSNLGNVKSLERYCNIREGIIKKVPQKILRPKKAKNGYLSLYLYSESKRIMYTVHRLVALTFIPNPENKPQVNHKNGVKSDNNILNLEWVSKSENIQHAFNTGLKFGKKGEKNHMSKLTNEQVLAIRNDNRKVKDIALNYNVCIRLIYRIKQGKMWSHI